MKGKRGDSDSVWSTLVPYLLAAAALLIGFILIRVFLNNGEINIGFLKNLFG